MLTMMRILKAEVVGVISCLYRIEGVRGLEEVVESVSEKLPELKSRMYMKGGATRLGFEDDQSVKGEDVDRVERRSRVRIEGLYRGEE